MANGADGTGVNDFGEKVSFIWSVVDRSFARPRSRQQ